MNRTLAESATAPPHLPADVAGALLEALALLPLAHDLLIAAGVFIAAGVLPRWF